MKTLIKSITIIGFAMFFQYLPAQQAVVTFEYDDAGNRTQRTITTFKATETEIENLAGFIVPTPAVAYSADELNANVYPNPTYGIINIEVDKHESETITYMLHDQTGKLIEQGQIAGYLKELSLESRQPGVYFITLAGQTKRITYKIVKQ
jgi:YD repeat-containing protein